MRRAGAALALLAIAAAACGGSSGGGSTVVTTLPPPPQARLRLGAQVFTANCARCHTLAAAGARGTTGPNLDTIRLPGFFAEQQVRNGSGTMPGFQGKLTDAQIQAVVVYLVANRRI